MERYNFLVNILKRKINLYDVYEQKIAINMTKKFRWLYDKQKNTFDCYILF